MPNRCAKYFLNRQEHSLLFAQPKVCLAVASFCDALHRGIQCNAFYEAGQFTVELLLAFPLRTYLFFQCGQVIFLFVQLLSVALQQGFFFGATFQGLHILAQA